MHTGPDSAKRSRFGEIVTPPLMPQTWTMDWATICARTPLAFERRQKGPDDFVDHIEMPGLEETGRARYLASVRLVHTGFSDYHEEIEFIVADEDKAVSYVRLTGTHDGDLMGLPPTGRKVDFRSMGILRFANGQAIERWGFGDSPTQMQQLGVLG